MVKSSSGASGRNSPWPSPPFRFRMVQPTFVDLATAAPSLQTRSSFLLQRSLKLSPIPLQERAFKASTSCYASEASMARTDLGRVLFDARTRSCKMTSVAHGPRRCRCLFISYRGPRCTLMHHRRLPCEMGIACGAGSGMRFWIRRFGELKEAPSPELRNSYLDPPAR